MGEPASTDGTAIIHALFKAGKYQQIDFEESNQHTKHIAVKKFFKLMLFNKYPCKDLIDNPLEWINSPVMVSIGERIVKYIDTCWINFIKVNEEYKLRNTHEYITISVAYDEYSPYTFRVRRDFTSQDFQQMIYLSHAFGSEFKFREHTLYPKDKGDILIHHLTYQGKLFRCDHTFMDIPDGSILGIVFYDNITGKMCNPRGESIEADCCVIL